VALQEVVLGKSLVVLGVFACLAGLSGEVSAQAPATAAPAPAAPAGAAADAPKLMVREGNKLFELGKYREALTQYEKAYGLRQNPNWLFNIAQAHRELGQLPEAIAFYERYLFKVPDASDKEAVQAQIAELKKRQAKLEEEKKLLQPKQVIVYQQVKADEPPPKPWYKRWYVWTAVGVAVAGAVVAGVVSTQAGGSNVPQSVNGNVVFGGGR
jgi:tetratricopeptide (TPR) repeat protein